LDYDAMIDAVRLNERGINQIVEHWRQEIIKENWKSVFNDDELDHMLKQMLHLDYISH
jgi:hypothetical protein